MEELRMRKEEGSIFGGTNILCGEMLHSAPKAFLSPSLLSSLSLPFASWVSIRDKSKVFFFFLKLVLPSSSFFILFITLSLSLSPLSSRCICAVLYQRDRFWKTVSALKDSWKSNLLLHLFLKRIKMATVPLPSSFPFTPNHFFNQKAWFAGFLTPLPDISVTFSLVQVQILDDRTSALKHEPIINETSRERVFLFECLNPPVIWYHSQIKRVQQLLRHTRIRAGCIIAKYFKLFPYSMKVISTLPEGCDGRVTSETKIEFIGKNLVQKDKEGKLKEHLFKTSKTKKHEERRKGKTHTQKQTIRK